MKSEIKWLICFRDNLLSQVDVVELVKRKDVILWELAWIEKRIKEVQDAKHDEGVSGGKHGN